MAAPSTSRAAADAQPTCSAASQHGAAAGTTLERGLLRGKKGLIGKSLLALWVIVTLIGLASLSVSHMAAMPKPDSEATLARAMLMLRTDPTRRFLVHVIYAHCSCTDRLFDHLMTRGPFRGAEEVVLFVGEDRGKRGAAERAGFGFVTVSAEDLAARYTLEAAPVLAAFDSAGRLGYIGGYFNHPSTLFPLDETIYAQLANGETPALLPVFGCAVSPRLQKSVDPLGIVYPKG